MPEGIELPTPTMQLASSLVADIPMAVGQRLRTMPMAIGSNKRIRKLSDTLGYGYPAIFLSCPNAHMDLYF